MSENAPQPNHTEHALLVLLGQYAQHLGLIQALMAVYDHPKEGHSDLIAISENRAT